MQRNKLKCREFRNRCERDEYKIQHHTKKLSVSQQADLIKELKRIKKHTIEKPMIKLETNIPERRKSLPFARLKH